MAADRVGQLRAGADQPVAHADQHQGRLLLSLSRSVCEAAIGGADRGAVALANKTARIVWAMMARGEAYRQAPLAGAA